jgi:hypothetical protein
MTDYEWNAFVDEILRDWKIEYEYVNWMRDGF